jgi:serine phosphatase RsbU (regulator of sigma subunit)
MIALHVEPPQGHPFDESLDQGDFVIGRSSRANVVIPDRSLSRQHARLRYQDEAWVIEDLGSRNGTLVNRLRIDGPTALSPGDVVNLGASVLTVREIGGLAARERPPSAGFGDLTMFRPASEVLEESSVSSLPVTGVTDERIRSYAERLRTLNEVHEALGRSVAVDNLLDLILDKAFDALRPEEGAIFLKSRDGDYECAGSRSNRGSGHRCLYSKNLIREVAEKGLAALVLDAAMDDRFNQAASILNAGVRSLVAAPLLDPDGPLGMIVLGSTLNVRRFSEEDMQLLVSLASVASMRIRNLRLAEESAERKRLEREVQLARDIQMALLPEQLPELANFALHGGNLPSRGVSGDLYKVVERAPGGDCFLFLADVSGKGIAASLLTASLEALVAGQIEQGAEPDASCALVSRLLFERTPPEKYATGFLGVLEPATGVIRYTNAGHNPGLVVRNDGSTGWLEATGMPLGILPVGQYTVGEVALEPGDTLVLYTDGITEAENPDEEEFGEGRLEAVCARNRALGLEELAEVLWDELNDFADGAPFADDRTFVMVRRLG